MSGGFPQITQIIADYDKKTKPQRTQRKTQRLFPRRVLCVTNVQFLFVSRRFLKDELTEDHEEREIRSR
jgi:hypothetical protein